MLKPICVPCQRFYRPTKNGRVIVEGKPIGPGRPLPGTAAPEQWVPYKLWMADEWTCQGCGAKIVVGSGQSPISHDLKPDFNEQIVKYNATLQVNDC